MYYSIFLCTVLGICTSCCNMYIQDWQQFNKVLYYHVSYNMYNYHSCHKLHVSKPQNEFTPFCTAFTVLCCQLCCAGSCKLSARISKQSGIAVMALFGCEFQSVICYSLYLVLNPWIQCRDMEANSVVAFLYV
jgi:hypothetical protein